jgi:hypothetical protein
MPEWVRNIAGLHVLYSDDCEIDCLFVDGELGFTAPYGDTLELSASGKITVICPHSSR